MDIPVIIAAAILAVISAAEIFCLYSCPKVKKSPLTVIIRADDDEIEEKLRYIAYLFSREPCIIAKALIIADCAENSKKAVCARFCAEFPERAFMVDVKNENFPKKIIDFIAEV